MKSGGANSLAACRDQKVAALDPATRGPGALEGGRVDAGERAVGPGAAGVPRVTARGDGRDEADLAAGIDSGHVPPKHGAGASHLDANIAVGPSRVPLKDQRPGVSVVDEALLPVGEGNGVADNVIGGRVPSNAKLEAIPIPLKGREPPAIIPIAPRIDLLQGDGAAKHEEVEPVVDVVPEAGVAQRVARAGA